MIEHIPILFSEGITWRYGKPFYSKELPLISPYLVSYTSSNNGFINSVCYFVFDKNNGAVWGHGDSQIEAIKDCKRLYKKLEKSGSLIDQINKRTLAWNAACEKEKKDSDESKNNVVEFKAKKEKLPKKLPKRAIVFAKNNGKCFYCDDQLEIDGEWHIEHKTPKSKGGSNDLENLVPACPSCNLKKSAKTAKQFLEASA